MTTTATGAIPRADGQPADGQPASPAEAPDATSAAPLVVERAVGGGPVGEGAGGGPAAPGDAAAGGRRFVGSLSPSRAADFVSCPLKYRFRVVDRLPEPPSPAATRGTMVHSVLERLFDLPPAGRTPAAAVELLPAAWADLLAREPELAAMFPDGEALEAWLASARELLAGYFALEDPRRLAPAARELYVEHVLGSGLRLRGYVDRLDEATTPDGLALRVVDYKTGRSPGPAFEGTALFQMRFYALLLWRIRGVVPRELRLYYLGDRTWLRVTPDESDLLATERRVQALWAAIDRAHRTGDWRATPSKLCGWCDHQSRCPAFGGTPPPLPVAVSAGGPLVDDADPAVCEAAG
jgi:putative RecB family exonuclease